VIVLTITSVLKALAFEVTGADGTRVLSEASVREMQRPQAACPEPELLGDHWGLGWFLRTGAGPTVFGHDGNTLGQAAVKSLSPDGRVTMATLEKAVPMS